MARVFFRVVLFCMIDFFNQSLSPDQRKRELLCGRFLQYDEKEAYENFKQFYEDTLPEFRKAGTVVQFKVTLRIALLTRQCFQKIQ